MTADDLDRLALENPEQYDREIQAFYRLAGQRELPRSEDLRATAIPQTRHLDRRRYGLGLDRITSHMRPLRSGELVVLGAREGHGKSAFAEIVALSNSLQHRVLYTTLELTAEEVRDRMLAKLMHCSLDQMHAAREDDNEEYCAAMGELQQRDLMIWEPKDAKDRSLRGITQRALDVTAPLVIIDWTRMIEGWDIGTSKPNQIMKDLRTFVRTHFITIVLVAQLNRDAAGRRPHAAQLQDTGLLEQLADRVILLWRPFTGNKDNLTEIIIPKNRVGPRFRAHAGWVGPTMDFYDYTDEQDKLALCCHKKAAKGKDE